MILSCLRHPALPPSWTGRFLGQLDPRSVPIVLSKIFSANLKSESYSKIISSDLVRCSELAHFIHDNYLPDIPLTEDNRIREISFGLWEGKSYQEISENETWKEDYNNFILNFPKYSAPQAETNADFQKRITDFIDEVKGSSQNKDKILIITHAGVIRQLASYILEIDLATTFRMHLSYLSINQFQIEKEFTSLLTWNENWNLGE